MSDWRFGVTVFIIASVGLYGLLRIAFKNTDDPDVWAAAFYIGALLLTGLIFLLVYVMEHVAHVHVILRDAPKPAVDPPALSPSSPFPPLPPRELIEVDPSHYQTPRAAELNADLIYNKLYRQFIPPTRDNIARLCNITSHGAISAALDVLAEDGLCTEGAAGKEREWIYNEPDRSESY